MARISAEHADTPLCVEPNCSKPRYRRRRICKDCFNATRRESRKRVKSGAAASIPAERVAEALVGNFEALAARKTGVRALADDARALRDWGLVENADVADAPLAERLEMLARLFPEMPQLADMALVTARMNGLIE